MIKILLYVQCLSFIAVAQGFDSPTPVTNSDKSTTMVLNYDGFFDRIDDIEAIEYSDIKLAFYFTSIESNLVCPIRSATLKTKFKAIPVYYLADGEVILPYDRKLDQDKAQLLIETDFGYNCGLNMRLENRFLLSETLPTGRLVNLVSVFDNALQDLGGMMSFLVPNVDGLTFLGKADETLTITNGRSEWCSENQCKITIADLKSVGQALHFSSEPLKIMPYINAN